MLENTWERVTFLMGGGGGLYTSVGGGLIFGMLIGLHIWGAYIRGGVGGGGGGGRLHTGDINGILGMLFGRPTKVRKLNNIIKKNPIWYSASKYLAIDCITWKNQVNLFKLNSIYSEKVSAIQMFSLREKRPNTEFFLVRFVPRLDQKKLRIWTLFTQCVL